MLCEKKKFALWFVLALMLLHLVNFLVYYLPNYVTGGDAAVGYIISFTDRAFSVIIPALISTVAFQMPDGQNIKRAAVRILIFSLPSVIYDLPYYYLYTLRLGEDSVTGLFWGLGAAAVLAALGMLRSLLLYLLCRAMARSTVADEVREKYPIFRGGVPKARVERWKGLVGEAVEARRDAGGAFSLDEPIPFGILGISVGQFLIMLGAELYTVVDYLVSFAGSYRQNEILLMTVTLLFIVAMLFVCQLICHGAARLMRKKCNKINSLEE